METKKITGSEAFLRTLDKGLKKVDDLINKGVAGAISSGRVTFDFARMVEGAEEIGTADFGDNIIAHM